MEVNVYYIGDDLKIDTGMIRVRVTKPRTLSWLECKQWCASVGDCEFWSYHARSKNCFAKTNNALRRKMVGFISGPATCKNSGENDILISRIGCQHVDLLICNNKMFYCHLMSLLNQFLFLNPLLLRKNYSACREYLNSV